MKHLKERNATALETIMLKWLSRNNTHTHTHTHFRWRGKMNVLFGESEAPCWGITTGYRQINSSAKHIKAGHRLLEPLHGFCV